VGEYLFLRTASSEETKETNEKMHNSESWTIWLGSPAARTDLSALIEPTTIPVSIYQAIRTTQCVISGITTNGLHLGSRRTRAIRMAVWFAGLFTTPRLARLRECEALGRPWA
jgi:hypothetical protein